MVQILGLTKGTEQGAQIPGPRATVASKHGLNFMGILYGTPANEDDRHKTPSKP